MNCCMLIGTVVDQPEFHGENRAKEYVTMRVACDKPFRYTDGSQGKNIFNVRLWRGIADEIAEVCSPGSLIAIRGRMESDEVEENGVRQYHCQLVAEKITFIHLSERS